MTKIVKKETKYAGGEHFQCMIYQLWAVQAIWVPVL